MEQKKILWILLAVSVFILIIFGTAILLYSPSSGSAASLQQAAAVVPAISSNQPDSSVDPDSWVRNPETQPGLDSVTESPAGTVNLTIVNRNEPHTTYETLDVAGLTRSSNDEVSPDASLPPEQIPGQTSRKEASVSTDKETSSNSASSATATSRKKETQTVSAPVKKAKPARKATIVTDYWIQAGSYSSKINAEHARATLAERYLSAEIFTRDSKGKTTYRVRVGPYNSKAEADYWLGTVKNIPDFPDSYVSEVKTRK